MSIHKRKLEIRLNTLLIVAFFSYELVNSALSRIIGNPTISSTICDIILLLILSYSISMGIYKGKKDVLIILLLSSLAFVITLMIHPEYRDVMLDSERWSIFKMVFVIHGGVFGYVFIRGENKGSELLDSLKYSAIPVWICYTVKSFGGISFESISAISGNLIVRNYNQVYGFGFLFVAIICLFHFHCKKVKWCGVLAIISIVQILKYASRTALLGLGVYIILLLFVEKTGQEKKYTKWKKCFYSLIILICFFVFSSDSFIGLIKHTLDSYGISSRNIDHFLAGGNELDGGRIWLYQSAIDYIRDNIWGLGVYSDHYIFGTYAHNIVLQMLMSFGWILGGFILAILVYIILKMFRANDSEWRTLFLMFFSMSIIRLLVSYSFWYDENFWIMIALYMSYRNNGIVLNNYNPLRGNYRCKQINR